MSSVVCWILWVECQFRVLGAACCVLSTTFCVLDALCDPCAERRMSSAMLGIEDYVLREWWQLYCVQRIGAVSRMLRGVSWMSIADDCVLGAECWMLPVECCVLWFECCVLGPVCWVLCSEFVVLSVACWALDVVFCVWSCVKFCYCALCVWSSNRLCCFAVLYAVCCAACTVYLTVFLLYVVFYAC